jgi:hypothetical protein
MQMVIFMKDNGKTVLDRVMVECFTLKDQVISVTGVMIWHLDSEYLKILKAIDMRDNGKKIN